MRVGRWQRCHLTEGLMACYESIVPWY
jgi:hypothetical protein